MYVTFLASKIQSNAGIYRVPDSVRFDQVHITDVLELVPVHLWLDHAITTCHPVVVFTQVPRICSLALGPALYFF